VRAVAITGPGRAEVYDAPMPVPGEDAALVRVHVAPLCTEYRTFASGGPHGPLGHEAMGTVIAAPAAASATVREGQRVVAMPLLGCGRCRLCQVGDYIYCEQVGNLAPSPQPPPSGTMAEFIVKPVHLLIPVPDDVPDEHAALACCGLGASFGAVERLSLTPFDTVLVTGLGPVGLGAVINAVFRGANVIAVDDNAYRADLALRLGASAVVDPGSDDPLAQILKLTHGLGADAAIECSGAIAAHRLCVSGVRRRGSVAFVANSHEPTPIVVSDDLMHRGVTLFGSWHYNLFNAARLMEQIRRIPESLGILVTHRFELADVESAWRLQLGGRSGKVMLTIGGPGHA
jgi:L-iditol 2-dehydrogenase